MIYTIQRHIRNEKKEHRSLSYENVFVDLKVPEFLVAQLRSTPMTDEYPTHLISCYSKIFELLFLTAIGISFLCKLSVSHPEVFQRVIAHAGYDVTSVALCTFLDVSFDHYMENNVL